MKVTCAQCLAVYNISEDKLNKEISRTTCRKCGYKIEIRRPVGIPKLQPNVPKIEHISSPSLDIMDQAIPKRLNDDERTHLDEARSETPRPETNTNLAFGPGVAFMVEDDSDFSEPVSTAPSIQKIQEEKEEREEGMFQLDWVMVFGFNLLSIAGVALVALFRKEAFFVLMLGLTLFGVLTSLLVVATSRFGSREGSIYTSVILAFFLSVGAALLYTFYFEDIISSMKLF